MRAKLTQQDAIERIKSVHGDNIDCSRMVYAGALTKIELRCKKHDWWFWILPHQFFRGKTGCKKCGSEKIKQALSSNTENFILKATKVHKNFYNYSRVDYINSHTKVRIRCPEHGEFSQTPSNHLTSNGCPKCGDIKTGDSKRIHSLERCKKIALQYNYRIDLLKTHGNVYQAIWKNGWEDECFSHMGVKSNKVARHLYITMFLKTKYAYAGLGDPETRHDSKLFTGEWNGVLQHALETGEEPVTTQITFEPLPAEEAAYFEGVILKDFADAGYKMLNKAKTGSLGGCESKYTKEEVFQKLKTCGTISEAKKKYPGELMWTNRNNCRLEAAKHMVKLRGKNGKKSIYVYFFDGSYFREFDSVTEVATFLKRSQGNISRALSTGGYSSSNGVKYRFSYTREEKLPPYNKLDGRELRRKPVLQICPITKNIIKRFESCSEAGRQFDITNVSISTCCTGKLKTAGGFIWKYE